MIHPHKHSRSHRRRLGTTGAWHIDFATGTLINCGSDASLDDLFAAEITIDAWVKQTYGITGQSYLYNKGTIRCRIGTVPGSRLNPRTPAATTDASSYGRNSSLPVDGLWHYVTIYYNDAGDRKLYVAVDGNWDTTTQTAAVDALTPQAASDWVIGNASNGSLPVFGSMSWFRISDNDRYSRGGADFDPPPRYPPPAVDANTTEQWNLDDAGGTTIAAQVNAANNGTLVNGVWRYG